MKPEDLDRRLRAAPLPPWDAAYAESFVARVVDSAPSPLAPGRAPAPVPAPRFRRLAYGIALLAAGAAAGIAASVFLFRHRHTPPSSPAPSVLSSAASAPLRVWIEVQDAGHRHAILTFSGQSLRWNGQMVEVLANPDGQVLLVGEDSVWSNRAPSGAAAPADFQPVRAHLMPPTTTN